MFTQIAGVVSAFASSIAVLGATIPLGKEIFYLAPNRKPAVEVNGAGSAFTSGVPKVLFELNVMPVFPGGGGALYFAPTRDGQRFIVNTILGDSSRVPITVVLNWTADLKR